MSEPVVVEVPCPDCGQASPEPLERLLANDVIPCSICMGLIDLSAEECRTAIEAAKRRAQR